MENNFRAFISYSSKDKVHADDLVMNLEKEGVKCWIAPRDIPYGMLWPAAVMKALKE